VSRADQTCSSLRDFWLRFATSTSTIDDILDVLTSIPVLDAVVSGLSVCYAVRTLSRSDFRLRTPFRGAAAVTPRDPSWVVLSALLLSELSTVVAVVLRRCLSCQELLLSH